MTMEGLGLNGNSWMGWVGGLAEAGLGGGELGRAG